MELSRPSELLRLNLEGLCLHATALRVMPSSVIDEASWTARDFLGRALNAPREAAVEHAVRSLIAMGALGGDSMIYVPSTPESFFGVLQEVLTDAIVAIMVYGQTQLRADAVRASHQHGALVALGQARQSCEPADAAEYLRPPRTGRCRGNAFDEFCAGVNVHAGIAIGEAVRARFGFCHERCALAGGCTRAHRLHCAPLQLYPGGGSNWKGRGWYQNVSSASEPPAW